jgi:kynurenine formamidase
VQQTRAREVLAVEISQSEMIQEIVDFVQKNPESHASRVVLKTAWHDYNADASGRAEELAASLAKLSPGDVEYCYYLVK